MSLETVARKFVDMCNQGRNFDVMRTMYAANIVSVEADGEETAGQQAVIKKSEDWGSGNSIEAQTVGGPFFNGSSQFAIHFTYKFTPKGTGKQVTMREVAVYTVQNDKIAREQFFYDGHR